MAAKCPMCSEGIPAAKSVASTNGFHCPKCDAYLAVSSGSRGLAAIAGLLAGYLAWRLCGTAAGTYGWALTVFYCVAAFGVVAALAQMLLADYEVTPEEAEPAPAEAAGTHGHGGHH